MQEIFRVTTAYAIKRKKILALRLEVRQLERCILGTRSRMFSLEYAACEAELITIRVSKYKSTDGLIRLH